MDLIILPFHDWRKNEAEEFNNRDGHLMRYFDRDERVGKVLVVDRPVTLPEMVVKRKAWRVKKGEFLKKRFPYALSRVGEKTFVLDLFCWDLARPLVMQRDWWGFIFRQAKVIAAARQAAEFLGMQGPVLYLGSPIAAGVVGKLGERLLVFDAEDNWLKHPTIRDRRGFVAEGYRAIREKAGVIFANSDRLKEFFSDARTPYLYTVRNGVSPEFFGNGSKGAAPPDIRRIKPSIVGYAGRLARRTDRELISYLAEQLPQVNFVFIGKILDRRWAAPIFRHKNVHFLGYKRYSQLPSYLAFFDVCIIPNVAGEGEYTEDPIKLYEYLAAGRPVVTTAISGVEIFKDVITVARNKEEFRNGILFWLKKTRGEPELPGKLRAAISAEHTWEFKARKMLTLIEERLKKKEGR